jgi:hypothetical protein
MPQVGLVQANPRSGDRTHPQAYLPYSVAMLQAYAMEHASRPGRLRFLMPLAWRVPLDRASRQLRDADIVAFSVYVWNCHYSLELARLLKQERPERLIVFGGPHVPRRAEQVSTGTIPLSTSPAREKARRYFSRFWNVRKRGSGTAFRRSAI